MTRSTVSINPEIYRKLSYEPLKDFEPVTNGFFGQQIVILNKNVPVKTLAELVDTGRTAQAVRQLLPKAYFATLYAKPAGRPIVDTFVKEFKQTKWIHFPWDIEYSFATPIKDGGRAISGP